MLCYVMLCYVMLCYVMLCYVMLYYIILYYITLHYITLHYITLHYITLHYITLHYITLHYITLHYIWEIAMCKEVLPQSVFLLPTGVAGSADDYTNHLVCNSSRGLKQSLVVLSFDPLFDDPSKFAK